MEVKINPNALKEEIYELLFHARESRHSFPMLDRILSTAEKESQLFDKDQMKVTDFFKVGKKGQHIAMTVILIILLFLVIIIALIGGFR